MTCPVVGRYKHALTVAAREARDRGVRVARLRCGGEGGSVVDAEVPDESDDVAIGIEDGGWRTASHLCLPSRSPLGQAPCGDISDVAVQVVSSEVQQG